MIESEWPGKGPCHVLMCVDITVYRRIKIMPVPSFVARGFAPRDDYSSSLVRLECHCKLP